MKFAGASPCKFGLEALPLRWSEQGNPCYSYLSHAISSAQQMRRKASEEFELCDLTTKQSSGLGVRLILPYVGLR